MMDELEPITINIIVADVADLVLVEILLAGIGNSRAIVQVVKQAVLVAVDRLDIQD